MCLTIQIAHAICVVALAVSEIILGTVGRENRRLNSVGWLLLAIGGTGYLVLTWPLASCQERSTCDTVFQARAGVTMQVPETESSTPRLEPSESIRITSPSDGAETPHRTVVTRPVFVPDAEVWAVMHPPDLNSCWIQPRPTVRRDGSWQTLVYLGRDATDFGRSFELLARMNPVDPLQEGQILDSWPNAEWYSEMVELVRQ